MFVACLETKKNAKLLSNCNTTDHSSSGFSEEVRKKLFKAWGKECQKCKKHHFFAAAYKTGEWRKKAGGEKEGCGEICDFGGNCSAGDFAKILSSMLVSN